MLFRADPEVLCPGDAFLLGASDLPEMAALREGMKAFQVVCYERRGFERLREMALVECRV